MSRIAGRPEDNDNPELIELAGDMAWGALKAWHQARDLVAQLDADDVRNWTVEAFEGLVNSEQDDPTWAVAAETCRLAGAEGAAVYLNN